MIRKGNKMKKTVVFMLLLGMVFICGHTCSARSTWMESKDYWPSGEVRTSKKLDGDGNLLEEKYYREDGTMEQYIKYDDEGHKTGEAYYGEDGQLREGADGWAAMRWKYEDGNMIAEGYYGPDGNLKERKQYNSEGDLVAKQYVGDKEPLPAEEYNPIPPLAGETTSYYDSYGRPEGTTSVEYDDDLFPPFWDLED
jgi:antitoxin component YwqK of YwqJK toxin-antitoxin module